MCTIEVGFKTGKICLDQMDTRDQIRDLDYGDQDLEIITEEIGRKTQQDDKYLDPGIDSIVQGAGAIMTRRQCMKEERIN